MSAAILVGGESRRMGTDKALLEIDGEPLVDRIGRVLRDVSDDVFVVGKVPPSSDVRFVADAVDAQTPLVGVDAALRAARHDLVFICGCDMPYVSPALIEDLVTRIGPLDAVAPIHNGKLEALHGVWSKGAADKVAHLLSDGERGLRRALAAMDIVVVDEHEWRRIDPEGLAFTNLNTPDDVAAIGSASTA